MRQQITTQEQDPSRDLADPPSAAVLPPAAALPSITTVDRAEWERLFPGSPEDHDLLFAHDRTSSRWATTSICPIQYGMLRCSMRSALAMRLPSFASPGMYGFMRKNR